jgi:hypothetical protein
MSEITNYEIRYVAFIDILGFKNIIEKSEKKENEIQYIEKAINILKSFTNQSSLVVTQFSDSVVISTNDSEDNFQKLLKCLLEISIKSIGIWYLLRGGITKGKLIHTKDYLFGPAMNYAYKLESELAIFPRIIIDENLIGLINQQNIDFFTKDFDGIYFLDYLNPNNFENMNKEDVKTHLDSIRDTLNNFDKESINDLKIKQKYLWLENKLLNFYYQKW